jgi:hypothetical protein
MSAILSIPEPDPDETPTFAPGGLITTTSNGSTGIASVREGEAVYSLSHARNMNIAACVPEGGLFGKGKDEDPPMLSIETAMELARSEAERLAEMKYLEFISSHNVQKCVEAGCGVCAELSQVKADAIVRARNQLLQLVYVRILEVKLDCDADISASDFLPKVKEALAELFELDVAELW